MLNIHIPLSRRGQRVVRGHFSGFSALGEQARSTRTVCTLLSSYRAFTLVNGHFTNLPLPNLCKRVFCMSTMSAMYIVVPRPPHVQPPPRVHGSPPPRGETSPSDGSPPGGGGTVHHSRPANSSITQLKIFFGACDFLLISYCSWAK